jgi:glycosyltransferase involved in cell wall biosynthesis
VKLSQRIVVLLFMVEKMVNRILYVQFGDAAAYPPVEHSSHILAERGWDVILLGTTVFNDAKLKLSLRPNIKMKNLSLAAAGGRQEILYLLILFRCLYLTCTWRPTWIYASDPLSAPAVWLVRKLTRSRVIYHEHDAPSRSAERASSWFKRTVQSCRKMLAKEVEYCVIPQEERLVDFLRTTGRLLPTMCVWNCPRLSDIQDIASRKTAATPGVLILYYHGSINPERLPRELVIAASRFKGAVRLRVAGYESPGRIGYVDSLMELAGESGAPGIVESLGVVPLREDLLRAASEADVGLSFMPMTSNDLNARHMVGASNKPFDYMACGLPLLVSELSDWTSTFVEPGYARACDPTDVESIETQLRWYIDHPDEREKMGRRCAEKIEREWNYDAAFSCVVTALEGNSKPQTNVVIGASA